MRIYFTLPGVNIVWKKEGFTAAIFSFLLGIFYSSWRRRKWKGWHVGFIVKVLETGEIITSQAVGGKGNEIVTYPDVASMGDCRFYSWLDENIDNERIEQYAAEHEGVPYDNLAYLWTILGGISQKLFGHPFRLVNRAQMCWENLSEFDRHMGKELQPEAESCMINKMMDVLEGG